MPEGAQEGPHTSLSTVFCPCLSNCYSIRAVSNAMEEPDCAVYYSWFFVYCRLQSACFRLFPGQVMVLQNNKIIIVDDT